MAKVQVFENKPPVLGINSLGRIGKLTLWHHINRKYFKEIVVNLGREAGTSLDSIAQAIEKDTTYGLMHRFLYGIKSERLIEITDEKQGKMLIDGIPSQFYAKHEIPPKFPGGNTGWTLFWSVRENSLIRQFLRITRTGLFEAICTAARKLSSTLRRSR